MSGHIKQLTKQEYRRLVWGGRDPTEDYEDLVSEGEGGNDDSDSGGDKGGKKPPDDFIPPPGVSGITVVTGIDDDGSAFIELSWNIASRAVEYEVRWREQTGIAVYSFATVETTEYRISGLIPNTAYLVNVQAFNAMGIWSGYGDDIVVTTSGDTGAPGSPAGFNLVAGLKKVIGWWVKATESDFSHYLVYVATDSGFTSQVAGSPFRSDTSVFTYEPSGTGTFYVKVTAVDTSGNESTPTSTLSATTGRADASQLIVAGTIVGDLIAAGTIVAGNIQAGAIQATHLTAGIISSTHIVTDGLDAAVIKFGTMDGDRIAVGTLDADRINVTQLSGINANLGTITAGTLSAVTISSSTITGSVIRTADSGSRVVLAETGDADKIRLYNSGDLAGRISANADGQIFLDGDTLADGFCITEGFSGTNPGGADRARIYKASGSKSLKVRWNDGTTGTITIT